MTGNPRAFRSRQDVERAVLLLEEAARDLRCSLDHAPGQHFWVGYQQQAQAKILEVSASMDVGYFGLPHPWDLRGWGDAWTRADAAMQRVEQVRQASRRQVVPADRDRPEYGSMAMLDSASRRYADPVEEARLVEEWERKSDAEEDAMKHAIECLTQTNHELQAMLRRAEIASGRRHARVWKMLATVLRKELHMARDVAGHG